MSPERVDFSPKTLLEIVTRAARVKRRDAAANSHAIANSFVSSLESAGAQILDVGRGNANYFLAEIAGLPIALSIFASQEQWWEKPSQGFRNLVKEKKCKWGVLLFDLKDKKALWIDGEFFDRHVLKGREKINFPDVAQAERAGYAIRVLTIEELVNLLSKPIPRLGVPRLIRKSRKS
ncbi:MAG TPA: hypothetical protein PKH39_12910 [Woeseiaceae bacterium]|nr:hypothetical protein [Woeseiaceae bacterium]